MVPPKVVCTGGYFLLQGVRASVSFNVGYQGPLSTLAYSYRTAATAVQFVSTSVSQTSVNGSTAAFSGVGTVNGNPGYAFSATVTDGGAAGSGRDTVQLGITGPGNYSYSVSGTLAGGDVVVQR